MYRDSYDTDKINEFINDSFVSTNPSGFSYVANGDLTYPTIPENTRPAGYYVSNPHIPEVWYQANVPSGEDENYIMPSGNTAMKEFLNEIG